MSKDPDNSKDLKELREEYRHFLKVTSPKKECKHIHPHGTTWERIDDLELSEITCNDCGEFLGYAYRKLKTIPNERVKVKIIKYLKDDRNYAYKE